MVRRESYTHFAPRCTFNLRLQNEFIIHLGNTLLAPYIRDSNMISSNNTSSPGRCELLLVGINFHIDVVLLTYIECGIVRGSWAICSQSITRIRAVTIRSEIHERVRMTMNVNNIEDLYLSLRERPC